MDAKKKYITAMLALAALLAGLFYINRNSDSNEEIDGADVARGKDQTEIEQISHAETVSPPSSHSNLDGNAILKARLFDEYRCPQIKCSLSPFIAENEYEAMWLHARGYPSQKNREEAKSLPTSELKHQASTGDLIAASLYGERLIEEKEWAKAYGVLVEAASRGNLYAMYALSDIAAKNPDQPNGIESKAWLRLAYLSGDYKATMQLARTFPQLNGMPEQLLIDKFAADDFRKLMRYRSYPRPPAGN